MNNMSVKRTSDWIESEEERIKMKKKVFGNILESFSNLENCVHTFEKILSTCNNGLDDLRSQLVKLESLIEKPNTSSSQQSPSASDSIQERDRLKRISDQEIIEEITIEGSEQSDNISRLSSTKIQEDRIKKQRRNSVDDEISIITQRRNDYCQPGTSRETTIITKSNPSQSHNEYPINDNEFDESIESISAEDAVQTALLKTKGVLSAQELSTFLYLTDSIQDSVQLAKISFTNDIKMLYFQLMTFHFHLKVANDALEKLKGPSNVNRELENKVQNIIHMFQTEIYRKILPS